MTASATSRARAEEESSHSAPAAEASAAGVEILAPVAGRSISLDEVPDPVFSSRALGEGVGIEPADGRILAPVDGELITVAGTGHAFGIRTADGIEVLIHIGIDTVQMQGKGFDVRVTSGSRVSAGDLLAEVDLETIRAASHPTVTLMTVTNTAELSAVDVITGRDVAAGETVVIARR